MRKIIYYVVFFGHLSAIATEKKVEVVYLTQGYKNTISLLNQDLTINQIGAQMTMQTMDIRLFQDLRDFARQRKVDPAREKIKIRAEKGKIFIEGQRHPFVVANTSKLKLLYLDLEIPFSQKISLGENLQNIEKFFLRQAKTSMRWNDLFFGERVAQAQVPLAIAGTLAAGFIYYLNLSAEWDAHSKQKFDGLFGNPGPYTRLEIGCDKSNDSLFFIKRGSEKFEFNYQKNGVRSGLKEPRDLIEITHQKASRDQMTTYRFDLKENEMFEPKITVKPGGTEVKDPVRPILSSMAQKFAPGGRNDKFPCPASPEAQDAWKALAEAITDGKKVLEDEVPGNLRNLLPPASK